MIGHQISKQNAAGRVSRPVQLRPLTCMTVHYLLTTYRIDSIFTALFPRWISSPDGRYGAFFITSDSAERKLSVI